MAKINEIVAARLNEGYHKLLYLSKAGSQLIGTSTENSDTDYFGIYVPNKTEMLLGNFEKSITIKSNNGTVKNSPEDFDCTLYSIQQFMNNLEKADTSAIDLLFSDTNWDAVIYKDYLFEQLDKKRLLSKNLNNMTRYAKSSMDKYGSRSLKYKMVEQLLWILSREDKNSAIGKVINLREMVNNVNKMFMIVDDHYLGFNYDSEVFVYYITVLDRKFYEYAMVGDLQKSLSSILEKFGHRTKAAATTGTDWKAYYHALRILDELNQLHKYGGLYFPPSQINAYRKLKSGEYTEEFAISMIDGSYREVAKYTEGVLKSALPETLDKEYMKNVILSCYEE